jgi:O-acetyl-ADP-ribose deacetylase (regulator of RNase III)
VQWSIRVGDLLDVPADVLVCSGNVYLTLSGGVGGAFALRYGPAMHESLNEYLRQHNIRHVARGTVVTMPSCGSPYQAVLHAVAVDGMYESSPEIVATVIVEALHRAAELRARTVALAALATGYGRLTMADFAQAIHSVIALELPPLERVVIGLRSEADCDELMRLEPRLGHIVARCT